MRLSGFSSGSLRRAMKWCHVDDGMVEFFLEVVVDEQAQAVAIERGHEPHVVIGRFGQLEQDDLADFVLGDGGIGLDGGAEVAEAFEAFVLRLIAEIADGVHAVDFLAREPVLEMDALGRRADEQDAALAHAAKKRVGDQPPQVAIGEEQDEVDQRDERDERAAREPVVARNDEVRKKRPDGVKRLVQAGAMLRGERFAERIDLPAFVVAAGKLDEQAHHHDEGVDRVMLHLEQAEGLEEAGDLDAKTNATMMSRPWTSTRTV
jgi:hypothetical protein